MVTNSTEKLGGEYDLESSGSAFLCTSMQEPLQLSRAPTNVVLCWFQSEWCVSNHRLVLLYLLHERIG